MYFTSSNLNRTKLIVRSNTPNCAEFTTSSEDARISFISNSSNTNSTNIFYIGTSNNNAYIAYDNNMHIQKLASFSPYAMSFQSSIYSDANLLPTIDSGKTIGNNEYKWRNMYLNGNDVYLNEAVISYHNISNELCFMNASHEDYVRIQAKHISIYSDDNSRCIFSVSEKDGVQLTSYDAELNLISQLDLNKLSTSEIHENGSLYYTDERACNVIKNILLTTSNSLINTSNKLLSNIYESCNLISYIIDTCNENIVKYINNKYDDINYNTQYSYSTLTIDSFPDGIQTIIESSNAMIQKILNIEYFSSNYLKNTCNQLFEIVRTIPSLLISNMISNDNYTSNRILALSQDINDIIKTTSNTFCHIINIDNTEKIRLIDSINVEVPSVDTELNSWITSYITLSSNNLYETFNVFSNLFCNKVTSNHNLIIENVINYSSNIIEFIDIYSNVLLDKVKNINLDNISNGKIAKYITNNIYNNDLITCNLTSIGHISPLYDSLFDLGASNNRWKDIYLSGNTIYLGDIAISLNQSNEIKFTKNNAYTSVSVSKIKLQDKNNKQQYIDLNVTNDDLNLIINPVNIFKLQYTSDLIEGSNLFYKNSYVGDIANASNIFQLLYINETSNSLILKVNDINLDNIINGSSNQFVVNGIYSSNLYIHGTLSVSNLNAVGNSTFIHPDIYEAETLQIHKETNDGPALKIIHNDVSNIAEFYSSENKMMIINNKGNLGIINQFPNERLDIIGSLKISEKINDVSCSELNFLKGIHRPLQYEINNTESNASNYINDINDTMLHTLNDNNILNNKKIDHVIYYVNNISNMFLTDMYNRFDIFYENLSVVANSILNVSNLINLAIAETSNQLSNEAFNNILKFASYVNSYNSNSTKSISTTSNILNSIAHTIPMTPWTISTSPYTAYFMSNVGIGTSVISSEKLAVIGNIKVSGLLNNISEETLGYLDDVRSPVQQQINLMKQSLFDYTSNTSNIYILNLNHSSNHLIQYLKETYSYLNEYMGNVSNILSTEIKDTSNGIYQMLRNKAPVGYVESQWNRNNTNGYIYTYSNVGIGTSTMTGNNKLHIHNGDVMIVDGILKQSVGNLTESYQLERWKNLATYETDATKYIYYNEGKVGIQKAVPYANLHVGSSNLLFSEQGIKSFSIDNTAIQTSNSINNICSIFESSIWSKANVAAASDARIKTNIKDIDDDNALQKILAIEPKTYDYIDPLKGTSNVYGFIAQQIKEVIPEAVTLIQDVIPNIFVVADATSNIIIFSSNYDVNELVVHINKKIKIMDYHGEYDMYKIINVNANMNTIEVDKNIMSDKIFVYGMEVNDFHVLDKSYIFTLNVCATQILSRELDKMEQDVKQLEALFNISETDYLQMI